MRTFFGLMLVVLMAGWSGQSLASGLDNAARNHLGAMVNGTDPSIYMTSRGTTVGLGSFSMRLPQDRSISIFSGAAPSISTGCGGWDIFAGSFSIMSADRIMQTLRSMASAIPMVAFRMALAWLSEQLEKTITDIFNKLMDFNEAFQSGCELQESIMADYENNVNPFSDGGTYKNMFEEIKGKAVAIFQKTEDAAGTAVDPTIPAREAVRAWANGDPAFAQTNWIWDAMNSANIVSGGSGATSTDLRTDIMSFTGAVFQCVRIDAVGQNCATRDQANSVGADNWGESSMGWEGVPPTIEYRELVEGKKDSQGNKVANSRVLACVTPSGDPNPCSIVRAQERNVPLEGVEAIIKEYFLGSPETLDSGIIGKANTPGTVPTEQELRILSASGPFGRAIMDARKVSGHLYARQLVHRNVKAIANEVAFNLVNNTLLQLKAKIQANNELPGVKESLEPVQRAMLRANQGYTEIAEKESSEKALQDIRAGILRARPGAGS